MKPRSTMFWPILRLPLSALQLFSFFLGSVDAFAAGLAACFAAESALAAGVVLGAALAVDWAAGLAPSGFLTAGVEAAAGFFGSFGFGVDIVLSQMKDSDSRNYRRHHEPPAVAFPSDGRGACGRPLRPPPHLRPLRPRTPRPRPFPLRFLRLRPR